jgi:hypothetical protein
MLASRLSAFPVCLILLSACGSPEETLVGQDPPIDTLQAALVSQSGESVVTQAGAVLRSSPSEHVIYIRTTAGAAETVLVGQRGTPGLIDGTGGAARLSAPAGLGYDSANNAVYVADLGNRAIRKITLGNSRVTTLLTQSGAVGLASAAGYPISSWSISDVAVNVNTSPTELYFADSGNHMIWRHKIGSMSPLAGLPGAPGYVDAVGVAARFRGPDALSYYNGGGFFGNPANASVQLADAGNGVIRSVRLFSLSVSTVGPIP